MVAKTNLQTFQRFYIAANEGILQTWGKAVDVCADVEEIHGTIKLVVWTVYGIESSYDIMQNKPRASLWRHGKISVTAQIIVSRLKTIESVWMHLCFYTGHPGIYLYASFVSAQLVIVRAFHRPLVWAVFYVAANYLLPLRSLVLVFLSCLHTHVHKKQRSTQWQFRNVIMIPYCLHGLVR